MGVIVEAELDLTRGSAASPDMSSHYTQAVTSEVNGKWHNLQFPKGEWVVIFRVKMTGVFGACYKTSFDIKNRHEKTCKDRNPPAFDSNPGPF